ncbi:hypothetical protein CJF32_00001552 [Rutstroemia sp. NJR-2017a WRK4]|nr:hypothetical protein CJF32_00001552 [Rutstroemia sp. NJR-2017a WRK4]
MASLTTACHTQAQTPSQRKANLKFAAKNEGKMGKPEAAIKKKENFKSPISPFWLGGEVLFCSVEG